MTTSDDDWRGVATEDLDEVDRTTGLRLASRSRRLLADLLRPRLRTAWVAAALLLVDQALLIAGPLFIAYGVDTGFAAALDGRAGPLMVAVVGYAVVGVADAATVALFIRISGRLGQDVLAELRVRVFRRTQELSLSFHERYTSGRVISRMTSDLEALQDLLEEGLEGFFLSGLTLVVTSIALLVLDIRLGLVALVALLPMALCTRWYLRASRGAYRGSQTWVARVIVQFAETMNGIRAVQAYRRERRGAQTMAVANAAHRDATGRALVLIARFSASMRLVANLSLVSVLILGAFLVLDGELGVGLLTAFVLYLRRIYGPLDQLALFANAWSSAAAALEKISGLLEERASVREPERPVALAHPVRGELVLDEISFGYGPTLPSVVSNLDLTVPAGQSVALVGATGAGKSTVAKIVARFYDPVAGEVRLDGIDLRDLADVDLRRAVVMVTQESFLFSGTIADNIALGRPDATREQVRRAADAVGADEFISALPDGYDTDVRRRGGRLSAGQRQLVSFARVLLADPAVVVLDEATSALDLPSERAVQHACETVLAGRTSLIIAHRLSTVVRADRVIVLDGGRIVEDGAPGALVSNGGRFDALHAAWRDSLV